MGVEHTFLNRGPDGFAILHSCLECTHLKGPNGSRLCKNPPEHHGVKGKYYPCLIPRRCDHFEPNEVLATGQKD